MKTVTAIGILFIVLGVAALVSLGVAHAKRQTAVADAPATVTRDRERAMPLRPFLSVFVLAGGLVLVKVGTRKKPVL
jgi:hypothetical protein